MFEGDQERALGGLRLLKEADAERGASRSVEASLLAHRRFAPSRSVWGWAVPVLACALAMTVAVRWPRPDGPKLEGLVPVHAPRVPTDWARKTGARPAVPKPIAKKRAVEPEEVATEFYPLTDIELPFDRGTLMRTVVPASTMLRVGMPVQADYWNAPLTADVLYGDEGTARAIRFVTFR